MAITLIYDFDFTLRKFHNFSVNACLESCHRFTQFRVYAKKKKINRWNGNFNAGYLIFIDTKKNAPKQFFEICAETGS